MIIVYCCYGGAHSSPIAAALHLGQLESSRIPGKDEIWNVHYYDKVETEDRGRTLPVGHDEWGHEVYVCGRGKEKTGVEQAIKSGVHLAGGRPEEILLVDTLPAVNSMMRLGGFLSRQLKWISVGRPLVMRGTQQAFPALVRIVEETKAKVAPTNTPAMQQPSRKKEEN